MLNLRPSGLGEIRRLSALIVTVLALILGLASPVSADPSPSPTQQSPEATVAGEAPVSTAESTPAEQATDQPVVDEAQTDAPVADEGQSTEDAAVGTASSEVPTTQAPAPSSSVEAEDGETTAVGTFSSSDTCTPDDLYYTVKIDGSNSTEIWKYDTLTGESTRIYTYAGDLDGLAAHEGYLYAFSTDSTTLLRLELGTGNWDTITGLPKVSTSGGVAYGAAVNPKTGILYYTFYAGEVYAFDLKTQASIGLVGKVAGIDSKGDIAFDPAGNLYVYGSAKIIKINAIDVPVVKVQDSGTVLPGTQVASGHGNSEGLAWVGESDYPLWGTNWNNNQTSGWRAGSETRYDVGVSLATMPNYVTDLASCAAEFTKLSVSKNVVARYENADQFKLEIEQGSTLVATATTTGTALGVQDAVAQLRNPSAGATYTVRETASSGSLANYSTELVCKNTDTGEAVAMTKSSDTEYSFTYPDAADQSVDCEFTNTSTSSSTLAVTKTLPGGRVAASDQFTIQVRQGGADGSVVAQSTTAGTGTTVDPGTGTIARFGVEPNQQYTITELAGPGVDMSKYDQSLSCTDANGQTTGLPIREPFTAETGVELNLEPDSQVTCTMSNLGEGASIGVGEGLTCETGSVYGIVSSYTNPGTQQVVKIKTTDGSYEAVHEGDFPVNASGAANSLAISQGGLYGYYSVQQSDGQLPVYKQYYVSEGTHEAGSVEKLTKDGTGMAIPDGVSGWIVRGGINPTDGVYWLSSSDIVDGTTRHHLWAYDTLTETASGYVGYFIGPEGRNGDLVFDQDGNMLLVSSTSTAGQLWRLQGDVLNSALDTAPRDSATLISTTEADLMKITDDGAHSVQLNGVTFDNDGYLWVSSGTTTVASYIYKLDPNTGQTIATVRMPALGTNAGSSIVDLADCNDPGGIRLQKDYPDGRVSADDQVTLEIRRDGLDKEIPGGKVTTIGNNAGLQSESASVVIGVPKNTYTLTETRASGAPFSDYTTSDLVCVDKTHGDTPVNPESLTRINDHQWQLDFEAVSTEDGELLGNLVCTFTNRPNGTLQLEKQLIGDRADDADQFQVQILTDGSAVEETTTTGSGSTIENGATGVGRAQAGKSYSFDELGVRTGATSDEVLGAYLQPLLTCQDSTGRQAAEDLPSNVPLGEFGSIKPVPGSAISCVITNQAMPVSLDREITVEKFGANCDTDQELCALSGAEFALYDTDPALADSRPIEDGLTVNGEGSVFVSVPLVTPATYWLVETKAPSGFNLLATPVRFTLTESGVELVGEAGSGVSVKDGSLFTIQVVDTTPAPLPHSGGTGPVPHMVVAALLFGAALTYQFKTSSRRRLRVAQ